MKYFRTLALLIVGAIAGCTSSSTTSQQSPQGNSVASGTAQTTSDKRADPTGKKSTAQVRGVVRLNGEPLPGVMIYFHSGDGLTSGTEVQEDGTYLLPFLTPGKNQVAISPTIDQNAKSKVPGKSQPIPDRYSRMETSGLHFDLIEGPNTINIDLK